MFSNPQKNLLQTGVGKAAVVADLGSGAGFYSIPAALMVGVDGIVYAIDINQDLLSKLKNEAKSQNIKNIRPIAGNIEKLGGTSLADDIADLTIISNTFFSLEDKNSAIKEAKRITKNKGRILFVEWNDNFAGIGPHKDHLFKEEDAKKLFEEAGLAVFQKIDAGDHHYGLILRKS